MDQRKSSFISLTTALETLIILFTFFKRSSYALIYIVTCVPSLLHVSCQSFDLAGQLHLLPRVLLGQFPLMPFQALGLPNFGIVTLSALISIW